MGDVSGRRGARRRRGRAAGRRLVRPRGGPRGGRPAALGRGTGVFELEKTSRTLRELSQDIRHFQETSFQEMSFSENAGLKLRLWPDAQNFRNHRMGANIVG